MAKIWAPQQLKPKKWKGQPFRYAHEKLDGWRVTGYKQSSDSVLVFGKDHRPHLEYIERFPRLKKTEWYRALKREPVRTAFDAEIVVPGKPASFVSTALRDPSIPIKIVTFAVPWLRGKDFNAPLVKVQEYVEEAGLDFARWWYVDHKAFKDGDKDKMLKFAEKLGIEGFVLKQHHYEGWFKVKAEQTVDCIVTDWEDGEGKYEGQIGALVVSVLDENTGHWIEIANCSGMTDAERKQMSKLRKGNKILDRVCEVKYQNVSSKGRLRHPRFVRWRSDKLAEECTIDQLEE